MPLRPFCVLKIPIYVLFRRRDTIKTEERSRCGLMTGILMASIAVFAEAGKQQVASLRGLGMERFLMRCGYVYSHGVIYGLARSEHRKR